jgi:hypothetical protein
MSAPPRPGWPDPAIELPEIAARGRDDDREGRHRQAPERADDVRQQVVLLERAEIGRAPRRRQRQRGLIPRHRAVVQ